MSAATAMDHAAPTPGEDKAAPKKKSTKKKKSEDMIQMLAAVPEDEREFTILAARSDERSVLLQRLRDEGGLEMTYTSGTSLIPVGADDNAAREFLIEAIADCKSQLKLTHAMRARGLLAEAAALPADAASVPLKKRRTVAVPAGVVGRTTVTKLTAEAFAELERIATEVLASDADDADLFMHCVAKFVLEKCELGAHMQKSNELYSAFTVWLLPLPRKPRVTQDFLKRALSKLEFRYHKMTAGRFWHGMRLHTAGKAPATAAGAAAAVGTAP